MNDTELLKKRLTELCDRAYTRGYTVYSDFLNMDEISTLLSLRLGHTLYGGYDGAERCVAAFGEDVDAFPIACIKIEPLQAKFADKLTHRDYLGALMHLGIERSTLGDILTDGSTAYLFCLQSISAYILDNLTRIKHTSVQCSITEDAPKILQKAPEEVFVTLPSLRADAVVAAVLRLSRSQTAALFKAEKVFINQRLCTKESQVVQDGDIFSVRGHGKFVFDGVVRETKKHRLAATVKKYK